MILSKADMLQGCCCWKVACGEISSHAPESKDGCSNSSVGVTLVVVELMATVDRVVKGIS